MTDFCGEPVDVWRGVPTPEDAHEAEAADQELQAFLLAQEGGLAIIGEEINERLARATRRPRRDLGAA